MVRLLTALLSLFFGMIILLAVYLYFSLGYSMVRQCERIEIGQSVGEVESLMRDYLNREEILVNRNGPGTVHFGQGMEYDSAIGLYTLSLFDDLQCNVYFREEAVIHVWIIAD